MVVFLESGEKREENLRKVISEVLDRADVQGKKVMVKPNYTSDSHMLANTPSSTLDILLQEINERNPQALTVAEGSGESYQHGKTTKSTLERFGVWDIIQKNEASFIDLNDPQEHFLFDVETIYGSDKIKINPVFRDYDIRISTTVPKSHDYAIMTGSMKNFAMPMVFPQDRVKIHGLKDHTREEIKYSESVKLINRNLARLIEQVQPDISIIDGFVGMEGEGPLFGTPINCGWALSSDEPLLCDCIIAKLMGLEPTKVGYLNYLIEKHPVKMDEALNDRIESLIKTFKLHSAADIQKRWE